MISIINNTRRLDKSDIGFDFSIDGGELKDFIRRFVMLPRVPQLYLFLIGIDVLHRRVLSAASEDLEIIVVLIVQTGLIVY